MAKNLLDQILSISGLKGPESNVHKESQEDSSGLSGVEKYLRKRDEAEQKAEEELTGVAKYLAQRAKEEESATVEVAKATGVEKYLARKSSVAKEEITAPAKPASAVDKYLARQSVTAETGLSERRVTPERRHATTKPAANKASATTKKKPVAKKPAAQPKQVKVGASKSSSGIKNLSEGATQCQAGTTKGTQCRRETGLTSLERTIDKQKYRFAVCNQHKNQSFKPFSGLM